MVQQRRLDDYYSFADDTIKQHPWYSGTMLILLVALLLIIAGYAAHQLLYAARKCHEEGECCHGIIGKGDDKQIEMKSSPLITEGAAYVNMVDGTTSQGVAA